MDIYDYSTFTPAESEFLAENEPILIQPTTKIAERLFFIMGVYGPFYPGVPTEVPLWLAVTMRENQQCRIVPPKWLTVEALEETLKAEVNEPGEFSDLPYYYLEIVHILLAFAKDDVPNAERVASLVDEIHVARENKLSEGARDILRNAEDQKISRTIDVDHIGSLETNSLREGLLKAMDQISQFLRAQEEKNRRNRGRAVTRFASDLSSIQSTVVSDGSKPQVSAAELRKERQRAMLNKLRGIQTETPSPAPNNDISSSS